MGEINGTLIEKNGKNGEISEEKSAFLESPPEIDAENQKEKASGGKCKKLALIGVVSVIIIAVIAILVGFFALNGKLEEIINEDENKMESLLSVTNLTNVIDDNGVTTTISTSNIDVNDSAEDNHDSSLEKLSYVDEDLEDDVAIVTKVLTTTEPAKLSTTTTIQTTTMDFCTENPCKNNGVCSSDLENNKFVCDCAGTGFEGETCETNINDCKPESCNNHGTCEDLINNFSCKCEIGYDGEHCENDIDECAENPCQNDGLCLDQIGKFACNCSGTGYEGETCEIDIDECLESPCENGECNNSNGSYTCNCEGTGFEGESCETDINDCETNPCKNEGTCTDTGANSFSCECPKYWEGKICETAQTKFAIREVHMAINEYTGKGGCGGDDTTVAIQINDKCTTKAKLYPVGTTVQWKSEEDLNDCATNNVFDPKKSSLNFHIKPTDKEKWYCVDRVTVVLDDQKSTKYTKETDDDWRQNHDTISVPREY